MIMTQKGTNKIYKQIKALKERKHRDKEGLFIAEGLRFVNEIPYDWNIEYYAFSESFAEYNDLTLYEKRSGSYIFEDRLFKEFSETNSPQGILAVCVQKKHIFEDIIEKNKNGLFVIAEELNDPGNLGTIIRTADACAVDAVFLSKGSVDLYNGKVLRSTMGSVFHVPVLVEIDMENCIDKFKKAGITLYAAHLHGTKTPYECSLKEPSAFVIGNEARGLTENTSSKCDCLIKIPMPGMAESLNASVAAAVLMYEAVRQRLYK